MPDPFETYSSTLESPATNAFAVTPDDTNDLEKSCRALNVATGGTIRLTTVGGDTVTITVVECNAFPIRCQRIWATGTTASGIVALY